MYHPSYNTYTPIEHGAQKEREKERTRDHRAQIESIIIVIINNYTTFDDINSIRGVNW
jgi:hypothetical protein